MVARINHGAHVEGVLFYNKLKTDKGEARVVLCHNLPIVPQDGNIDIRRLSEAFRPWMTHPRSRLREPVFHVSLNPNPKDRIDEMKMLEIAHYYMERAMGISPMSFSNTTTLNASITTSFRHG